MTAEQQGSLSPFFEQFAGFAKAAMREYVAAERRGDDVEAGKQIDLCDAVKEILLHHEPGSVADIVLQLAIAHEKLGQLSVWRHALCPRESQREEAKHTQLENILRNVLDFLAKHEGLDLEEIGAGTCLGGLESAYERAPVMTHQIEEVLRSFLTVPQRQPEVAA